MKVYSCSFFLLFLGILCVIPVQAGKNKGNLSNLVCFVRFLDEDNDEMFEHPFSMYEQLFNDATSGANSVYNYFREASYGQLENVDVAVGDTISQGEVIGEVSQPTRYYSVEGSHLNFMLTQDGNPVDPLDYLD